MSGEELKSFRERRGLSQDDLAELLNGSLDRRYTSSTISQWETGKRPVPAGVGAFLDAFALEQALPPLDTAADPSRGAGAPAPPRVEDEPPGGPRRQSPQVLAGGTYARLCEELFEMVGTGVAILGAALGNERLLRDGQIIDRDKVALGRAYGRLAETNETFRRFLAAAGGGGAWVEIAIVTSGTASAILRNHLQGGGEHGAPAHPAHPDGPREPDPAAVGI